MYEGVIHAALAQPWSFHNSSPARGISKNGMITGVDLSSSSEYIETKGSHILDAEDFFIDDLCEFSDEDIAAPIKNASLHGRSDDNNSASNSKAPSAILSDCTTANTSTNSGSTLLHGSPAALVCRSTLHIEMDSSLSVPCEDETGFEWLTSFGDDSLTYGVSNMGMDSFLLSNAEPFDGYVGLTKQGGYEDDSTVEDMKEGGSMKDTQAGRGGDHVRWDDENGVKELDAMMFMPHSTGSRSSRTKRTRSAGWSSSNMLCSNWDTNSPTNSLNSTSQMMPNPGYSTPSFLPKQELEHDEQLHGYNTHRNVELMDPSIHAPKRDKLMGSSLNAPHRDKLLSIIAKASTFCSNDQACHGWAQEDKGPTEESVSTYGGLQPRRCTHCLSQKTPQWRAGPQGPKTLCNACGVRFKSGRLFDEYRPAKSPTFLSYKHSNSHKKVMEMRRRKSLQYTHNHHIHQHAAPHQSRTPAPPPLQRAEVDPLGHSKLKIKINSSTFQPHSHFSDVTLISTRPAVECPSSFLH